LRQGAAHPPKKQEKEAKKSHGFLFCPQVEGISTAVQVAFKMPFPKK
jgi:hypothetical protein